MKEAMYVNKHGGVRQKKKLEVKFFEWMKITTDQIRLQKRGGFEWISSFFKARFFV